jgi:hypothetical protein
MRSAANRQDWRSRAAQDAQRRAVMVEIMIAEQRIAVE